MSQDALGALVGASQATVSRWEDPLSPSTPSAVELAELADRLNVDAGWLLGLREQRSPLPAGAAAVDQAMLMAFSRAESVDELHELLGRELSFGTLWVEIPEGVEIVAVDEAQRRVGEVDERVRRLYPELWQEWAATVLR